MNKTEMIAVLLVTITLMALIMVPSIASGATVVEEGTATIRGADLLKITVITRNNLRFALWNGTTWFELPFSIDETNVQKSPVFDVNGTNSTSMVSTASATISLTDVFSIRIPAMIGLNASSGEWWNTALDLYLFNRLSVQISDDAGYSCIIFVYYQTRGSCLPPDYSSYYTLPLFSSMVANQTQTNQTTDVTPSGTPVATFHVQSFSEPQIVKIAADSLDPPIYSMQTIMEQQFENTSSAQQNTSPFYLPASGKVIGGVFLVIEWNEVNDRYTREIDAYFNGQLIWTFGGISGYGSEQLDITNDNPKFWNLDPQTGAYDENHASIVLTTYAGYGYWDVRAYVYVVYQAATHFIAANSTWAQSYTVTTNTQNTNEFPTSLPDSIVDQPGGAMVYINAMTSDDQFDRYLDLYINDAFIARWPVLGTYDGGNNYDNIESLDITNFVLGAPNVTIGIKLICGIGTWTIYGYINVLYRPSVAPDLDPFWTSSLCLYAQSTHSGDIYDNVNLPYNPEQLAGTFSTETMGFGSSSNPYEFYTGLAATYPPCNGAYAVQYMQIHIHVTCPDGSPLPQVAYVAKGLWSGSNSGQTVYNGEHNIGMGLLTGASIGLSIFEPDLAALLALAALVEQYSNPPAPSCSVQIDSTGISMTYDMGNFRIDENPQNILLDWTAKLSPPGLFKVDITTEVTTTTVQWSGPSISNDDIFYIYGPVQRLPILTIQASTGGDNPPTDPPPNGYSCSYGCSPAVTAYPAASYLFDYWSLDGHFLSTDNPSPPILMQTTDHTLVANFAYASPPGSYDVTIEGHCITEGADINVQAKMDNSSQSYATPHTFGNLISVHNFTVDTADADGHAFKRWNTGETSTTISVSSGGTYIAYYGSGHDVAITDIGPSKTVVGQKLTLSINVTAGNPGDYAENLHVTLYANNIVIASNVTSMPSGAPFFNVTFSWNTTGFAYGNYTIKAQAEQVPGETDTSDNNLTGISIVVSIPGDINGNFKVGLTDLVMLAQAYGSHPGDVLWNANADIDNNGIVGLTDLVLLALHYGQHYP